MLSLIVSALPLIEKPHCEVNGSFTSKFHFTQQAN